MVTHTFSEFRKAFFNNLEKKTGWGKEEIKKMFDDTYFSTVREEITL